MVRGGSNNEKNGPEIGPFLIIGIFVGLSLELIPPHCVCELECQIARYGKTYLVV
ncbi:hypothetical protein MSP8886_03336 [Marinomonas spartinae]|uniref:Uncharacterized protein n=1 Tax=Marinomonas spartinae TaxID=1792290 RepID=A0A1A8TNB0_9GAMM|nr:hypothetical protein MSP8886_03336 [Marinomonas spartinae]